jgi:hypothetical protein
MMSRVTRLIVAILASATASMCVVSDPPPVNLGYAQYGYGYGQGVIGNGVGVGEPTTEYVSGMPPDPLYEQEPPSPGDGEVWIDGYWHWNGEEWVWVGGRWEQEQEGYVYVEPYYNYIGGAYLYTPGYWRSTQNIPAGWVVQRNPGTGRPPTVHAPTTYVPIGHMPAHVANGGTNNPPPPGGFGTSPNEPGRSPYGPVAPTRGINAPAGPEPYGPPPERAPAERPPIEEGGVRGEEPIILTRPREPEHPPATYTPAPGGAPARPSGPPPHGAPPPPPPPPARANGPAQAPAHK